MSDLIDRQAAIDVIAILLAYHGSEGAWIDQKEALDVLKSLPSAQPEQRWIPVTERLPDDYIDILVWFEYFRYGDYNCLYQTYGIGSYSTEYDSWMINHETGWRKLRVLAWMPLPKPYEG